MSKYISFHSLHTYPYANLNRDDLGSPKTMMYGGTNRIRISSQCLKRSIRTYAQDEGLMSGSVRTRDIDGLLQARLAERGNLPADAVEKAATIVGAAVAKKSGSGKDVLAFFAEAEIGALIELAESHTDAGGMKEADVKKAADGHAKAVGEILGHASSGVALFGRMFADDKSLSVDGATQVAHAFTVHEAAPELDYFTAVEDWTADPDHAGAGHLDTNEFSSGTFYKYANIGVAELLNNLNDDTDAAATLVTAFAQAFALANPSGKQTGTAAQTMPDLVHVSVNDRQPVNLCSAFEKAVRSRDGYRTQAVERLATETAAVNGFLGSDPSAAAFATLLDPALAGTSLGTQVPGVTGLVDLAVAAVG